MSEKPPQLVLSRDLASTRVLIQIFLPLAPLLMAVIAAAPGLYTPDSDDQLAQGMNGRFNDWHPPIMAILWGALVRLTGTPAGLFWLQCSITAVGIVVWGILFVKWKLHPGTHLLLLLGLSLPTSFGFFGVLWKDVGMALSLFTATGLVALAIGTHGISRWLLNGLAILLLLYGLLVRANSLPALLPLVLLLYLDKARLRPILITCVSAIAITGIYLASTKALQTFFKVDNWYPVQYVMMHDLTALSNATGTARIPDTFKTDQFSLSRLSENYREWTANYLFVPYDGFPQPPLKFVYSPEPQEELRRFWIDAVAQHPKEYLTHRWRVLDALMSRPGLLDVFPASDQETLSAANTSLSGRNWAAKQIKWAIGFGQQHTVLYNGWLWLIVLLTSSLGGWFAARKYYPAGFVAMALGTSGLFYMAPYLFLTPAIDFRYLYWCCIAGMISNVIVAGIFLTELRNGIRARTARS